MGAEHPNPEEQEAEEGHHQDHEPLLASKQEIHIPIAPEGAHSGGFTFNGGWRPHRDTLFTFLFITTVLVTYAFGFFAVKNADFDVYSKLRSSRYNPDSSQCEIVEHAYVGNTPTHVAILHGRKAYEEEDVVFPDVSMAVILVPLLATLVLTIPGNFFMLWLLHRYTREIVLVTLPLVCLIPVALGVYVFTSCVSSLSLCSQAIPREFQIFYVFFFCAGIVITVRLVWKNWSRVDLTIQILKTASHALKQNLSLLMVNPVLSLGTVMVTGPMFAFIWFAYFNGKVSPDFDVIKNPDNGCSVATGNPCCQAKQAEWVTSYVILACVASLWVITVASQLQILVVSGTISQWYFAPAGSSTVGTAKRSLRNAFGPSFGTACFSGLIITILKLLKSLMDRAVNTSRQGMVGVFLRACFSWLFQLVKFFTGFTSNFAAISGESFCTSARSTYDLLQRNWLSTLIVELMANEVLGVMAVTLAFLQSLMIFGAISYFTEYEYFVSYMVAVICFLLGLVQFVQVMPVVINTVYICYAMDKDVGAISKPDVHDVYMLLPPASSGDEAMLAVRRTSQVPSSAP